ncbi:hypothetical protein JCM8547_002468 [Rhodosporidiobolus lusitaniae]
MFSFTAQQTASPPSSTSLPEHWQFVPPPTDGPNTRARRAKVQMPYSGTAAPLSVELASRGPGSGREETGVSLRVEGEQGEGERRAWEQQPGQEYYYAPGPPTADGAQTFFAIDPTLEYDPSSLVTLPYTPAPESVAEFPPSSFAFMHHPAPPSLQQADRRLFSTSSVIDYGSPPTSPILAPIDSSQTPSTKAGSSGAESLATGMGLTKEEWLRLGGFEEPAQAEPALPVPPAPSFEQCAGTREAEPFAVSYGQAPSRSAHPLGARNFPPPSPAYELPVPPASAPAASTYLLPPLTAQPDFSFPSAISDELPIPPPLPDSPLVSRAPARSTKRRAPSPSFAVRHRPSPYPTSSSSYSLPTPPSGSSPSASSSLLAPPQPPPLSRNLTPISNAIANYREMPTPSAPPPSAPQVEGKRKSHRRRVSANHIPRPRNAFILFRSHAVSNGLIPKSMGITDHKNISQIVGSVWRGLSDEERKEWDDLAQEEKRQHAEKYPEYRFQPKSKGKRAPVGEGKKAKAKAAREALERAREDGLEAAAGSSNADRDADGDDEGDNDSDYEETRPRTSGRRKSVVSAASRSPAKPFVEGAESRQQRRMELIGQAMLEGEDDDRILQRVDEEMEKEDQALYAGDIAVSSPVKRASPSKRATVTPRKTLSAVQRSNNALPSPADILVNPISPTSSSSTLSPLRHSPYAAATQRRNNPIPTSPTSSASPSPKRMQHPGGLRGAGSPPSSGRHPLSRSHPAPQHDSSEHDLPAARRTKKAGAYGGLGVSPSTFVLPPSSSTPNLYRSDSSNAPYAPQSGFEQPLFAGPTDSRNFSLGKWELRKPSTAAGSRREVLARQEEEGASTSGWLDRAAGGGAGGGGRVPSFAINPKDFLLETGLDGDNDDDDYSLSGYDAASTVSGSAPSIWTAGSSSSASVYSGYEPSLSSVATSISRSPPKQPLFRRDPSLPSALLPSSSTSNDPFCASPYQSTFAAVAEEHPPDLFHFGSVDLFAKPPPALTPSRSTSAATLVGGEQGGNAGLGIDFGNEESRR